MKIINMLSDYAKMCNSAKETDNFTAYKQYTEKYPNLYKGVFDFLYMTSIDNLQPMIDNVDFEEFLTIAQNNVSKGIVDVIVSITEETLRLLDFDADFDLYVGLDTGNIGGCALPSSERPFVYIGIDREINEKDIEVLIPHELNHMVRTAVLRDINMFDFTERIIAEGLGTYCFVALNSNSDLTYDIIEKVMMAPREKVKNLIDNRQYLEEQVLLECGKPLTEELMQKFFIWNGDESVEHPLIGYFIGMCIIHDLVAKGHSFADLTVMPSVDVLDLWSPHS